MTLAQRLLLAIFIVTVATSLALGVGVREAFRRAEEERFARQFDGAVERLENQLSREVRELPALLKPLCDHDPVLDMALVDLKMDGLDPGRRLALSLRIPELMKAFPLDELVLVTGAGEVLGAGHTNGLVGSRLPELGARLSDRDSEARLRREPAPVSLEAHCVRSRDGVRVGLIGARHFESLLEDVGESHALMLSLREPRPSSSTLHRAFRLKQLGGLEIVATQSRVPLLRALASLDATILALGAVAVTVALCVAILLARGLARPIVDLSAQARQVVTGEPTPVRGRGGRELEQLAETFNRAIRDLTALRKRLAATERIAARREIARRVAHEIKNPLAPIRAAVETLRRLRARQDPAFDEYFDEATRTVLAEVSRITNIVQEFTRFARLPPPNPAPMDLAATVVDVVRLHEASGTPIAMVADELPHIQADRDQIVQVTTNLLQNALDATSRRSDAHVAVELRRRDAQFVTVIVRDNGPGVAAEIRPRLFEPYATTKEHGTGLGLAIAHRIAVEHGGDLSYRDARHGGAEFTLCLPINGPSILPEPPPSGD